MLSRENKTNGKPKAEKKQRGKGRARRGARQGGVAGLDFKSLNPLSVSAPVATSKLQRVSRPRMITQQNGDCVITHREYVGDIKAGTGSPSVLSVQAYSINPGQVGLFQWLSKIAANYESYSFMRLRFDYATEAPSSLGGSLVLAVDYDASDAAPVSKQQAMAYRSSVRSAPWSSCQHRSLAEDLKKAKTNFIRPGVQPPNTDIKTYDIGNLFVISQGVTTASAVLGELWVEYEVKLMTPVYDNPSGLTVAGGSIVGANTQTPGNPFGIVPTLDLQSYGIAIDAASRITFASSGYYLLNVYVEGTTITAFTFTSGPGVAVGAMDEVILASGAKGAASINVLCPGPGGYVDITTTAVAITVCDGYVALAPLNSLDLV